MCSNDTTVDTAAHPPVSSLACMAHFTSPRRVTVESSFVNPITSVTTYILVPLAPTIDKNSIIMNVGSGVYECSPRMWACLDIMCEEREGEGRGPLEVARGRKSGAGDSAKAGVLFTFVEKGHSQEWTGDDTSRSLLREFGSSFDVARI